MHHRRRLKVEEINTLWTQILPNKQSENGWAGRMFVYVSPFISSYSNPFFGNGAGYAAPGTAVPYPGISYPFDMIPVQERSLARV